jgi:hypothetical protein
LENSLSAQDLNVKFGNFFFRQFVILPNVCRGVAWGWAVVVAPFVEHIFLYRQINEQFKTGTQKLKLSTNITLNPIRPNNSPCVAEAAYKCLVLQSVHVRVLPQVRQRLEQLAAKL